MLPTDRLNDEGDGHLASYKTGICMMIAFMESVGREYKELFNLLDMHIPPGFGVHTPMLRAISGGSNRSVEQFFDARRLIGAKNALLTCVLNSRSVIQMSESS